MKHSVSDYEKKRHQGVVRPSQRDSAVKGKERRLRGLDKKKGKKLTRSE